jgi:MFS family permease
LQNKTKITQNIYWQPVFRTIKWIVPFFIAVVLYKKFYRNSSFSFVHFREQLQFLPWHWYVILACFSAVNWSLETFKWQYLLKKLEPMKFRTALKSVLSGVAVSQLLPYRTGEYLGRLAYVSDRNKINAGILSVAGSFSQLLITLIFGIFAFLYIQPVRHALRAMEGQMPDPLYLAGLFALLLILLMAGYFYLPRIRLKKPVMFFDTFRSSLGLLDTRDLFSLLLISFIRYAAFVVPYTLLAHHYGLPAGSSLFYGFASVACIFFLQTVSPNFILTDLIIRISVPALVFSGSLESTEGMYHIPGMFIYLFNIAIPMCLGAVVLLLAKLKK